MYNNQIIKRSFVPNLGLLMYQMICVSFIVLAFEVYNRVSDPAYNTFLSSTLVAYLIIAFSIGMFLFHRSHKKNYLKFLDEKRDPIIKEATIQPANKLMSMTGNFYRTAVTKNGDKVKCFCFAEIHSSGRCSIVDIDGKKYAIKFD